MKARRSWPLYARVLRMTVTGCTCREVYEALRIGNVTAHGILLRMRDKGLIHVGAWVERGRGLYVAHWRIGAAPDATRPIAKTTGQPVRREQATPRARTELSSFVECIKAMKEPQTLNSLVELSGGSMSQVRTFVDIGRELRLVRIGDWKQRMHGGAPAAMYEFAINKLDVPRPPRVSRRVVERRYQQGKRAKARMLVVLRALAANSSAFDPVVAQIAA